METKKSSATRNYLVYQASAYTAFSFWFPAMARCLYAEGNFWKPEFYSMRRKFFALPGNWRNYYRGSSPFASAQLFYPALELSYHRCTQLLAGKNNDPTFKNKFQSSVTIGALSGFVFNPLKAISMGMQNNKLNMVNTIRHIYNNYGRYGFWRGTSFFAIRNAIYCPCLLLLPGYLIKKFESEESQLNKYVPMALGLGTAAFIATSASMTMDILSGVCVGDPIRTKFKTNWDVIKHVHKTKGYSGLFVIGFAPRLTATLIELYVYTMAKSFYEKHLTFDLSKLAFPK